MKPYHKIAINISKYKDNENEFVRTEEVEFPFKKGDPIFINEVLKCKNFRGLLNTKGVKNDN